MQEFSNLVQAGGVGLAAMSMWIVWKIAGNHINHNTAMLQELVDVIRELKEYIKDRK